MQGMAQLEAGNRRWSQAQATVISVCCVVLLIAPDTSCGSNRHSVGSDEVGGMLWLRAVTPASAQAGPRADTVDRSSARRAALRVNL